MKDSGFRSGFGVSGSRGLRLCMVRLGLWGAGVERVEVLHLKP